MVPYRTLLQNLDHNPKIKNLGNEEFWFKDTHPCRSRIVFEFLQENSFSFALENPALRVFFPLIFVLGKS